MEKSIADLAENKVLILYLLNKLPDGIKSDNLYKIVSSANNINYFYFQRPAVSPRQRNVFAFCFAFWATLSNHPSESLRFLFSFTPILYSSSLEKTMF